MSTTTTEKLNSILDAAEMDAAVREELFTSFNLENPLELAKRMHAHEDVQDRVKSALLALRVSLPPKYEAAGLNVVIEKAMHTFWAKLAKDCQGVRL